MSRLLVEKEGEVQIKSEKEEIEKRLALDALEVSLKAEKDAEERIKVEQEKVARLQAEVA